MPWYHVYNKATGELVSNSDTDQPVYQTTPDANGQPVNVLGADGKPVLIGGLDRTALTAAGFDVVETADMPDVRQVEWNPATHAFDIARPEPPAVTVTGGTDHTADIVDLHSRIDSLVTEMGEKFKALEEAITLGPGGGQNYGA